MSENAQLPSVFEAYNECNSANLVNIDNLVSLKKFKEEGNFILFLDPYGFEQLMLDPLAYELNEATIEDRVDRGYIGAINKNDGKTVMAVFTDAFSTRIRFLRMQWELYRLTEANQ